MPLPSISAMCRFPVFAFVFSCGFAAAAKKGTLTMWTRGMHTIEGSSCRFADPRGGGLYITHSPSIQKQLYCAVSEDLYEDGRTCGRCYRLLYDGEPGVHGTPAGVQGSVIVEA